MSYNLPSISTLSAALGQDDQHQHQQQLQIAPELLDDPANQSSNHQQQDSSERNGAHQQWTTDSHYQVDESTDDLRFFDTQQAAAEMDQPPPRKKARSRASVNNIDLANIINEATVAEYEDPAGDWRSGVVYVHPAATANQACVRCHRIKRKCDNARPRCAGCWKADTPCVFEISPATAGLVVNLKNEQSRTTNELQIAQQRVAELEAQIAHTSTPVNHDHTPHAGSSTFPHPPADVERYYSGFAQTILGIEAQPDLEPTHLSSHSQPLPSLEVLQTAATTFFDAYHVRYPFLDRGEFMVDLQDIHTAEQGSGAGLADQRKEFSVLVITSVGAYLCEQKGEIESGTSQSLRDRAMRSLTAATSKTDLITIQAYLALFSSVLLGLHPETTAHNVLSLAMQTAISLRLHKKTASPPADIELRNRIWWTIYNLDRSLAAGLGRPLGIANSEIDADVSTGSDKFTDDVDRQLPSESDGHSVFLITNAITSQRRILARISSELHSQSLISGDDQVALEEEIHKWRSSWSSSKSDEAGQTYLRLLSLQALCLVYRPAPITSTDEPRVDKLGKYAQEALEIYQTSTTPPRDLITLAWRYQIVISLLYTTSHAYNLDLDVISDQLETCRQIVSSGLNFQELARLKVVYEQLSELLMDGMSPQTGGAADKILADMYGPMELEGGQSMVEDGERSIRILEARGSQDGILRWDHLI